MKRKPIRGEKIYVPTSLYVYRGKDDFIGGIANIDRIRYESDLPKDHYNYTMVGIKERPNNMYNCNYILENQRRWEEEYGDQEAFPDPDYRDEFNLPDANWTSF